MSKTTRKSRRDDEGTSESLPDGWEQFTSPDGHLYYYNADTKESRWEFPFKEKEEVLVRSKLSRRDYKDNNSKVLDQDEPLIGCKKVKKEKQKKKKTTEEQETVATAVKPSNVMFLKLQASLGGKLEAIHNGPPPIKNIRREGLLDNTGGTIGQEVTTSLMLVEEQYETETAGMSAAERLRFLRKKRQENIMLKRESSMGDDFMAEVAKNMKKKGVVVLKNEEREGDKKMMSWEEQEKQEEERKRRQMQEEMEIKKEKERNEQITKEREERREQERAEQLELEQRKQELEQWKQEQQEEKRKKQEKKEKKKKEKKDDPLDEHNVGLVSDCHEMSDTEQHVQNQLSVVENVVEQDDEDLDTSSPEGVKLRSHNRSQGSKHDISVNRQAIKHMESVEDDHPPADVRLSPRSEVKSDAVQDDKERMREKRRARKQREKDMLVAKLSLETLESLQPKSTSSVNELHEELQTQSTSSIDVGEDTKARKKQLRRERRQMAKMEAALAAQNLDGTGGQENAQSVKSTEPHTDSSNGPTIGLAHAGGYPMSGQPLPGQPPFSGGMYPPYPYMMMPPPPSPYGYYYPYVQPYSMPMPMYPSAMVSPEYQSMPPTPPHSANGMTVPSALIPYGANSTLANAYGYDMNFGGIPSGPELSRCDCCKGIGVGLVEKNGVCAHCNRLRLAFIVDSAQMRLRCSVCGGWGFQLLQANGMCEHCTRSAQKPQRRLLAAAAARRPNSVAIAVTAVPLWRISAKTKSEKDEFDDIDWDQSSLDDSDWDD